MRDSWRVYTLATKIRVSISIIICLGVFVGMLSFLTQQAGLAFAITAMLAGIPAIVMRLKAYNREKLRKG